MPSYNLAIVGRAPRSALAEGIRTTVAIRSPGTIRPSPFKPGKLVHILVHTGMTNHRKP